MRSLRPARDFAVQFGVKSIIYGPPGSGKTPVVNSAPRPVMLACEPGLLSMRNSVVPTFIGYDVSTINEFFDWFFGSAETKNFDTVAVDSVPYMCDIYLQDAQKHNKHGLKAYGEMASSVMKHLRTLYFTRYKHVYLIVKEANVEEGNLKVKKPYLPGQQLPSELPGLFDEILRLAIHNVPGMGQVKAFRCMGTIDEMARDRTGQLAEFEPPDFGKLVAKAMT